MVTWKITICYKGKNYVGWQKQDLPNTVQEQIENSLRVLYDDPTITIEGSGRTDTGVHALAQTASFIVPEKFQPQVLCKALNATINQDIRILKAEIVEDEFHARFNTSGKTYVYMIYNDGHGSAMLQDNAWNVRQKLDDNAMQEAADALVGTQDFSSFVVHRDQNPGSAVRTIYRAEVIRQGRCLLVAFTGSGFLYKMVRSLVGELVNVGVGRSKASEIKEKIAKKQRKFTAQTAPAHGLYLCEVYYTEDELKQGLQTPLEDYQQRIFFQ